LLTVFAGAPHCLWCPKSRWSPPLGTSIALKIGKDELEARKLHAPQVGGSFLHKIFNPTAHSLFLIPSEKSLNITLLPLELQEYAFCECH
jgi:hypothetical protein